MFTPTLPSEGMGLPGIQDVVDLGDQRQLLSQENLLIFDVCVFLEFASHRLLTSTAKFKKLLDPHTQFLHLPHFVTQVGALCL